MPRGNPIDDVSATTSKIRVRGARQHNLRNLNVDIPRGQFVVVTGPSGSGKSSLAIDTIFAEGQRQYIETLSPGARSLLNQMPRPAVDAVEGLQPTLRIDQRRATANRRSTVGTATEILDYLRVIMARVANVHCLKCGQAINPVTEAQIADQLLSLPERTKVMLLSPLVRRARGDQAEVIREIQKAGLVRARVDGTIRDLDQQPRLDPHALHSVEAVVDRLVIREGIQDRLRDSIGLAVRLGDGVVTVSHDARRFDDPEAVDSDNAWTDLSFHTRLVCPRCGESLRELEPRSFSFNAPEGACTKCEGLGALDRFRPQAVLDLTRSLEQGAILPWRDLAESGRLERLGQLDPFLTAANRTRNEPLKEWPDDVLRDFLYGTSESWRGLLTLLTQELVTTTSKKRQRFLESFRGPVICDACQGTRLANHTDAATLGDRSLRDLLGLPLSELVHVIRSLPNELNEVQHRIGRLAFDEVRRRLEYLNQVGLHYLTLSRSTDSLSAGEYQRVRLATSLGSGLAKVCYVLDEPTVGLHPRDNQRIIDAIRQLQRQGSTVLVVEHDEGVLWASDYLIEIGPAAGEAGGKLVARGAPSAVANDPESVTGQFLAGKRSVQRREAPEVRAGVPDKSSRDVQSPAIRIGGAHSNCIDDLDVTIPLQQLVVLTGVSGSGKSSLLENVLQPNLHRMLGRSDRGFTGQSDAFAPINCRSMEVPAFVTGQVRVDQAPIGRNSRSTPATYCGVFDDIRRVFSAQPVAKRLGFTHARFSFNHRESRCPTCKGTGEQRMELAFLPDLVTICPTCHGTRYNRQTMRVRYRDLSIADVLNLSIESAREVFSAFATISRRLDRLIEVGLGYLRLGQPAPELSGGEAQRLKLATELARPAQAGHWVYLLDEPTTGLHFVDVQQLLDVLVKLVAQGNSVITIEHNLDIIRHADWIVDLGPEGGNAGGQLVAEGPPSHVATIQTSYTGMHLSKYFPDKDTSGPSVGSR